MFVGLLAGYVTIIYNLYNGTSTGLMFQPLDGRKSRTTGAEKPHVVEKVVQKLSALQVSPTSSGESEKELPTSFTVPLMGRAMTYRHIPKI